MKLLPLAGALAFVFVVTACTPEQRCAFYQWSHGKALERAAGDQKKIDIANIAYAPLKAACAAQGIVIN